MNRKTYLFLPLILFLTFFIPLFIFYLQDCHDLQKTYYFDQIYITSDIAEKYPIISEIYASFYTRGEETSLYNQYLIDFSSANDEEKKTYADIKTSYEQEISSLIKNKVLSTSLANSPDENYTIDFGLLTSQNRHLYNLTQIFSMQDNKVISANYELLSESKKISSIRISNPAVNSLNQQNMAWAMITYLGLDSIEDWSYTKNGYESYMAKLQVYCDVLDYGNGYLDLEIGITPLGQHHTNNFEIKSSQ